MKLKEITMEKAITSPGISLGKVCMLVAVTDDTTIAELNYADGFYLIEDDSGAYQEEPEPEQDEKSEELMSLEAIPEDVYEEPAEEKKPTKKSKYDIPKIQALLNAGWGVKQIALEFGVSSETMSKYIHYRRNTGDIK